MQVDPGRLEPLLVEHAHDRTRVRRVRAVGLTFCRRDAAVLDQRLVVVQGQRRPRLGTQGARAGVAGEGVRLAVRARVHLRRTELTGQRGDLAGAVAPTDEQASATLAQPLIEVAQALEQEPDTRRRAVLTREDAGIEDERARDRPAARGGRRERRLVVETEIAAEPDEDRVCVSRD